MMLRCKNPDCESRKGPDPLNPMFNVTLAVDCHREFSEDVRRFDPSDFTCTHCGDGAEEGD